VKGFLAVGALGPVSRLAWTWKVRRGEAESPPGGWLHLAGFSRFHGGSRPRDLARSLAGAALLLPGNAVVKVAASAAASADASYS
jgi:hypothetical protein